MIGKIIHRELLNHYTVNAMEIGDSEVLAVSQCGDRLPTVKIRITRDGVTIATMVRGTSPRRLNEDVVRISNSDPTLLDTMHRRLKEHFSQGARRIVPR